MPIKSSLQIALENRQTNVQKLEEEKKEEEKTEEKDKFEEATELEKSDNDKMETHLVFVYGSLKRGGHLHHGMQGAKFIMECTTKHNKYALFSPNNAWPMLLKGKYRIKGELYGITAPMRNKLDWIEGHPNLFTRKLFSIRGIKEKAYVYAASERLVKAYMDLEYESNYVLTDKKANTQEWIIP